jgi:hypothetical protein
MAPFPLAFSVPGETKQSHLASGRTRAAPFSRREGGVNGKLRATIAGREGNVDTGGGGGPQSRPAPDRSVLVPSG